MKKLKIRGLFISYGLITSKGTGGHQISSDLWLKHLYSPSELPQFCLVPPTYHFHPHLTTGVTPGPVPRPPTSLLCPWNTWQITPPWALLPRRNALPLWCTKSGPPPSPCQAKTGEALPSQRGFSLPASKWWPHCRKPLSELSPQMLWAILQRGFIFLFNIYLNDFYDFHNLHDWIPLRKLGQK